MTNQEKRHRELYLLYLKRGHTAAKANELAEAAIKEHPELVSLELREDVMEIYQRELGFPEDQVREALEPAATEGDKPVDLKESFKKFFLQEGHNPEVAEKMAEVAAGPAASDKPALVKAFMQLGLTEAEAEIAANPTPHQGYWKL